ncbi:MAG TPA: PhoPQ-activated pathogenicity-related family protein [Candidatus Solibacter sp.]|jgi:PhoPQ-activated pathogenicity-related protein|nr:PhoPQ-activated pathogenicity-related family protein [Candidatus Solibacter sp.]
MKSARIRFVLVLAAVMAATLPFAAYAQETALDRYVHAPDRSYKFELVNTIPGEGYKAYVIALTSQTWKPPIKPDRTVWKHWLTVVCPNQVDYTTGFLYITGGSNKDKAPEKVEALISDIALTTHSVVAELRMVPNQPFNFPDTAKRDLVEDEFIAYTWDKFLRTGNDLWPARLPMTKSAVRAMDAVQEFLKSPAGGKIAVEHFVVAGGSKRGWVTWTTAAVDKRVVAIAPMVIDLLNNEKSFEHHYRAYGFYSPAVKDYEDLGIMKRNGTPQFHKLMQIEEPYEYRDRLTLPKYIINAAGDQYFLPDSSRFYFDDLKGEKYLRYVPNADHSLKNSDARQGLIAYYDAFLRNQPRPKFSWKFEDDGSIRVTAETKPTEVKLWQATNPEHRDFRLMSIGPAYKATTLQEQADGVYIGKVEKPAKGWTAYFVELTYATGGKYPLKFTTGVRIEPDTLPYEAPKNGAAAATP